MKATTVLLHIAASSIFLLVGYAGGYGIFSNMLIDGSAWAADIVKDVALQLICCIPVLLPASSLIEPLAALAQGRFGTSTQVALALNGIASILAGFILYVPFQLLIMMGAAF